MFIFILDCWVREDLTDKVTVEQRSEFKDVASSLDSGEGFSRQRKQPAP